MINKERTNSSRYGTCKILDSYPYTITQADRGFCEIVDYDISELLDDNFCISKMLPDFDEVAGEVVETLKSKDFAFLDVNLITGNGIKKRVVFYAIKSIEYSGVGKVNIIISDISEEILLNKTVGGILDIIPCGIVQYLIKEGETDYTKMQLKHINDNFFTITGYNADQFRFEHNNYMFNMIHVQDRDFFAEKFNECIRSFSKLIQFEFRIVKRTGEYVHVLCNAIHIPVSEDVNSIIGTFLVIDSLKATELMLKRSYEELAVISDSVSCGIAKINVFSPTEFIITYANESHARLTGYTFEEFGKYFEYNICHIIVESDIPVMREQLFSVSDERSERSAYVRIRRSDDKIIWTSVCVRECLDRDGQKYMLCVLSDVTDQKNMEQELYIQTERYKLLEESTDEISFDYNALTDTLIFPAKLVNNEYKDIIIDNYIVEKKMLRTVYPDDYEYFSSCWNEALRCANKYSIEYRSCIFSSDYQWYHVNFASFADASGKIVRTVGRMKNINTEKLEAAKLHEKIKTDSMTGLLNKSAMQLSCEEYIKNSPPNSIHAVMIIDIDDFKNINDVFGHMFGDIVIENVATTIKNSFRVSDFIGRIGGDEFMVLLKNTNHKTTVAKATELCESIRNLYSQRGSDIVPMSCSIGIAYYPENGTCFEELYSKSDIALYQSKSDGKNCHSTYYSTMKPIRKKRVKVDSDAVFRSNINNYDVEFVTFAFSLLSNSRSLNSSINLLLERIGIRYGLTTVAVYENDNIEKSDCYSNRWQRATGVTSVKNTTVEHYSRWLDFITRQNNKDIICINNCSSDEVSNQNDIALMTANKIHALVGRPLYENEVLIGFISFCDCQLARRWTEYERNTFFELSKIIGVFISLRKERNKNKAEIRKLSSTDNLTGLYNQESFKRISIEYIKSFTPGQCMAIIALDINNFSYVNENFGYDAGDEMLCDLADEIKRLNEAFGCRIYCDNFLICISDSGKDSIIERIKALNSSFEKTQKKRYPASNLKLSIGIYFIESTRVNITLAIENANLIRKSMKNTSDVVCGVYSEEVRNKRNHEQNVIGGIHQAIAEGELELFLQPKFILESRKVCGAEALSRWRNKDGSLKFPSEFILILERVGYVVELDYYIYEQVLILLSKWIKDEIEPIPISVNFSRVHTNYEGFSERVCSLADKYNVPKHFIEIEITESALAADTGKMIEHMTALRNAGFIIDIDDFGTGYSSLSLLLTAPVDIVKVDKSFLEGKGSTDREVKYVRQLINLIFAAEKELIFEGVETEAQAKFLLSCGVTMAQGFLFSHAIPVDEFVSKYLGNN